MINEKDFFDQPVKNNQVKYENIRKTASGKGDDYTTVVVCWTISTLKIFPK